jgi:hypothetical protein
MRKVFFFIALLFSVVCYAAPPPNQPTSFLIENQKAVFRSQDYIADNSFEVQEVAFVYQGNFEIASYQQYNFAKMLMVYNYFIIANRINSPPLNLNLKIIPINRQHSNFGYLFGENYIS